MEGTMSTALRKQTDPAGTGTPSDAEADVIVVGAGPTGLLLAGDLATAGARVLLLDKRPPDLSNLTRAFAVHARTLEVLDARGLADDLIATGRPVGQVQLFQRVSVPLDALPSRFPFVLVTPQYEVERLLRQRAHAAGVTFRHGVHVTQVEQDAEGVTVTATPVPDGAAPVPEGAAPVRWRAAWLVGTDGIRSTVRESVGIPFPGETVIRAMILADVRLSTPPSDVMSVAAAHHALGFLAPFGDGWYRFIGWHGEHALDEPVTLDEVREVARATLGSDYGMHDLRFATRFSADERQAPTYRAGRVFLAGDAAHVHSPAGGLGMNTGLQDAANLSWRLAAVVGGADAAVLDGYEAERHPVGTRVLRASGAILRLAVRPGRAAQTARTLVAAALARIAPIRRRAARLISAIGVHYDHPHGAHPLVGHRVPDLPLRPGPHGSRLAEALRAGRFVLIAPASGPAATVPPDPAETGLGERVVVVRADGHAGTLLVRPDGYLGAAVPGA
jgi:2-polyprenyl-6-methoxyphenol hydroxylase-like FAD-dependent oxidoreductase